MELFCPYCETGMDDPDECYDQDVTYEHECPNCEKNFVFTVEYTRTYSADKADCLNGAEHDYKKTATFPAEFAVLRCKMCGHEKPIPKGSNVLADRPAAPLAAGPASKASDGRAAG